MRHGRHAAGIDLFGCMTGGKNRNMNIVHRTIIPVFMCLISFAAGCSGGSLKQFSHPEIDTGSYRRIAVFPLENLTQEAFADEKIESLLIIDLLSRGMDVIEPGEVTNAFRASRIRSVRAMPTADIQRIGKMLHADGIIIGTVGTFAINKGIAVSYPEVSVHVMLIDTASGRIAWSAWHTSGGASFWTRHFGAEGATLDEVARDVIRDAVDTLF